MRSGSGLLACVALLVSVSLADAQEHSVVAAFSQAVHQLAEGDTTAAIAMLRETIGTSPDYGPALRRLGILLALRASERGEDFRIRLDARRILDRAMRLEGDDPEILLAYGLLLHKQGMRMDARRLLSRASRLANDKAELLAPEQQVLLHTTLGRIYETWWEDWQDLVMIPWTAQGSMRCSKAKPGGGGTAGYADLAVQCPTRFAELLDYLVPIADLKGDEWEAMLHHYRRVVDHQPENAGVGARLLGHLADAGLWEEFGQVARRLARASPADARGYLFLGLGLHSEGRDAAADSAFTLALARLDPADRRVFDDVALLLPRGVRASYAALDSAGRRETARRLFVAADPLFLTEVEERRLEHYARLAWAELKFSSPASGQRGWESERGRIWVRYGAPWRQIQCCFGDGIRHVWWSYGPRGPVFVFTRALTYRYARLTELSKALADELAHSIPETYSAVTVERLLGFPHQLARFRGRGRDRVRLELYAAPPWDSLGVVPGARAETGLFVFDDTYHEVASSRRVVRVEDARMGLTYAADLLAGDYRYGIEVRRAGTESETRAAARARESVSLTPFPPGQLSISDILLADSVRPLIDTPVRRDQLQVWPNRRLEVPVGALIHLYFEVYGLELGDDGLAEYEVEISVADATRRGRIARIARAVAGVVRRAPTGTTVAWQRVVPVTADLAVEFVALELTDLRAGDYTVRVRIVDRANEEEVTMERMFTVVNPENR